MTYAYVVQASSGEYSDRQVWNVAVYLDLGEARRHADRASVEARRRLKIYDDIGYDYHPDFKALVAEPNPFDTLPLAQNDDDRCEIYREGIDYTVETVRLFSEVPSLLVVWKAL